MARPIRARPTRPVEQNPLGQALATELEESSESLRNLLELLRLLDERGYLRFSTDLLREEDRVLELVSERFRPEDLRRAVRNLEVVVRAVRDVDPVTFGALARRVPTALKEAHRAEGDRTIGVLELVNRLRDPDVNRGVRMILGFLRGIGREVVP